MHIYIWQFLICLNNRKIYRMGPPSGKISKSFCQFFRYFSHSGAYFDIKILIFGSRASNFSKNFLKTTNFWPFRGRFCYFGPVSISKTSSGGQKPSDCTPRSSILTSRSSFCWVSRNSSGVFPECPGPRNSVIYRYIHIQVHIHIHNTHYTIHIAHYT